MRGRTVESHDRVLDFWGTLIEFGKLKVPFEVIHIDAHPDMWVGSGMYLVSGFLHIDSRRSLAMLKRKQVHSGNYLTFAIVYGWIDLLVWVYLGSYSEGLPEWNGDDSSDLMQLSEREDRSSSIRDLPTAERECGVPFKILAWRKFKAGKPFDYIALSRSPSSTPPESDELIPVVEEYMKQI